MQDAGYEPENLLLMASNELFKSIFIAALGEAHQLALFVALFPPASAAAKSPEQWLPYLLGRAAWCSGYVKIYFSAP